MTVTLKKVVGIIIFVAISAAFITFYTTASANGLLNKSATPETADVTVSACI